MEDQRRYWTEQGATKTFTTPLALDLFARHVPASARILDFGCGYGRTLAELRDAGYENLTGIDFSETLVERGRAENPSLEILSWPGGRLPFEDGSFDAAVMLAVLTCLPETPSQAEVLLELRRVLKPGGLLYVTDFLLNRDRYNLDRYKIGQEKYGIYGIFDVPDGGVLRHHDVNHMQALFSDFETLAFEERVFQTMHGHESNAFFALLRMPE
ncbi:class I SAM-dependent methyltransferase [Pseudodesulfovibrio sp.]|uniref:class I SAM-dependent methyltransferase n=1 Tax=Pseudodesulfovibrio sp. TaxID=2035812 RepID=UPI002620EA8C|nr:class I SAM-dependent methyltransferase [Pseudodesulfovibrio sp.]MDD3312252.1 class I SAM-dependent methyltransferase [Pseudodesulfovibrio sp.]